MDTKGNPDANEASDFTEILESGLENYLDPSDKDVFKKEQPSSGEHSSHREEVAGSPVADVESTILQRELETITLDDPAAVRIRIEELTKLSQALEKQLTIRTESRHEEIMDISRSLMTSSTMRAVCDEHFPKLRDAFDSYIKSSLYNVLQLPKLNAKKVALKRISGILEHLDNISEYCKILRDYDNCTRHRIIAGAVALNAIDVVFDHYPETARVIVLRSLKETVSSRIQILVRNTTIRLGSGIHFRPTVQLFHLLGINPEYAASYVLYDYRRHIFGVVFSTLQRYCVTECAPPPGLQFCEFSSGSSPMNARSSSEAELIHHLHLVGPNMALLMICKVLSELTSFFDSVASDISSEFSMVHFGVGVTPESVHVIQKYIKQLDQRTMAAYMERVLLIIRNNFNNLRSYACGLLVTVLTEVNIHGVKDKNDYLKVAMLLRFFMLSCEQCIVSDNRLPVAHDGEDSESTCILEENTDCDETKDESISGVSRILQDYGSIFLQSIPKGYYGNNRQEVMKQLEVLEETILNRLMIPYMEIIYQETISSLFRSIKSDSCKRLTKPNGHIHENCAVSDLCDMFVSRIKDHIVSSYGIKICALNPYNGWTPSSPFLGTNIGNWQHDINTSRDSDITYRSEAACVMTPIPSHVASQVPQDKTAIPMSRNVRHQSIAHIHRSKSEQDDGEQHQPREPQTARASSEANTGPRSSDIPDETHIATMAPSRTKDTEKLSKLTPKEWAYLYRNYGCVFISTTFSFWSALLNLEKVLQLQPTYAYLHLERMLGAYDWLLIRIIRSCQMSPNLDDLPHLREFIDQQEALTAEDMILPDLSGTLSMLTILVNRIESMATLLELLRYRLKFTCNRCTVTVKRFYSARIQVIGELRVGVYPMCMLSLLRKRLPGDYITQLLGLSFVTIPQACSDISELMEALTNHIHNVQGFIEAADRGSIPMPVKLLLWHYACLVLKSTMQALYDSLDGLQSPSQVVAVVNDGYKQALEHCGAIYETYRREAAREATNYWHAIRHLAVYETLMRHLLKQ